MTIRIDTGICNGCGNADEPRCVKVCPGDLLFRNDKHKSEIREPRDCWDCAACVKECPKRAIALSLPAQIGGRGATLKARTLGGSVEWELTRPDGSREIYKIKTRNIKGEIT